MTSTVRFKTLRKKLDQLGYRQTFGLDSLCLVEKLLADLERLKCRSPTKSIVNKCSNAGVSNRLENFTAQIRQLTQENNHLHQTLMKQTEAFESTIQDLKSKLRKLENENYELRFLNNQYLHKIKSLERESYEKNEKILHLQEKTTQAIIQTHGQENCNGQSSAFRRQRMEIGNSLPLSDSQRSSAAYIHVDDPYIANMLEVADKRISQLQKELNEINASFNNLQYLYQNTQQQLTTRESEIERLNRQITRNNTLGSCVDDLISTKPYEAELNKLTSVIEKLEDEKQELELQLSCSLAKKDIAEEKVTQVITRNIDLEEQLNELKNLTDRVQQDKNQLLRTSAMELGNSAETDALKCEKENLEDIIRARDGELLRLENEKRAINDKLTQLTCTNKQLEDELSALRQTMNRATAGSGENKCTKKPFFTKFENNVIEIERKYGRQDTMNDFKRFATDIHPQSPIVREHAAPFSRHRHRGSQQDVKQASSAIAFGRRAITPPPRLQNPKTKESQGSRPTSPVENIDRIHRLPRKATGEKSVKVPSSTYQRLKSVEEERDYYKQCYDMLRAREDRITSPPTRDSMLSKETALEEKVRELTKERDDLKKVVCDLESQKTEIQRSLKEIKDEKDHMQKLFRDTEQERRRLEQEVTVGKSVVERSQNRRLERENEQVCQELQTLAMERDALRDKLKLATDTQIQDRRRLENQISQLQSKLIEGEKECEQKRQLLEKVEQQLRIREQELADSNDQILQHMKCGNQLKKQLEQMKIRMEDVELKLHLHETSGIEHYLKEVEDKLAKLETKNREQATTIENLLRNISALDREKDQIQCDVDIRTEKLAAYEETLQHKERVINDLKITKETLEVNLDRQRDEIVGRDKEIRQIRHQLDVTQKELQSIRLSQTNAVDRSRTMQDDLRLMTQENQRLHADLDAANQEKHQLKLQIKNYVAEVHRIEELFKQKDQERTILLEQFQNVSMEANSLESQNNHLESETATIRVALHAKNIEVQHLQTVLASLQQEIEQYIGAQNTMELDLSQLKRTISALNEENERGKIERDNLQSDFHTVKALCTRLETDKEELIVQLSRTETECEKLQKELVEIRRDLENLQGESQGDRLKAIDLETLLSDNRRKEYQAQLSYKDLVTELQTVNRQLVDCEDRLLRTNREAMKYRSRVSEAEMGLEKVRRQMTNEKYEKERALQELRKLQCERRTNINLSRISENSESEFDDRLRSGQEIKLTAPSKNENVRVWLEEYSSETSLLQKDTDPILDICSPRDSSQQRQTMPAKDSGILPHIPPPPGESNYAVRTNVDNGDKSDDDNQELTPGYSLRFSRLLAQDENRERNENFARRSDQLDARFKTSSSLHQ